MLTLATIFCIIAAGSHEADKGICRRMCSGKALTLIESLLTPCVEPDREADSSLNPPVDDTKVDVIDAELLKPWERKRQEYKQRKKVRPAMLS